MDEPAVEKAGAAPLKPDLDEIAALNPSGDLPALLGRQHLGIAGDRHAVRFRLESGFRGFLAA